MAETKPNIVKRNTPGGSIARSGLAAILAVVLTAVVKNNDVEVDADTIKAGGEVAAEILVGGGTLFAGLVSAGIRYIAARVGAAA